jgi:hypothetical protein
MREDISLTKLMVDPENPRLEVQPSSRDAVRELFKSHQKKMMRLAEDISTRGRLSPLEKIGASPSREHKGRYLVGEGNRRVAALMALYSPDLVKGVLSGKGHDKLRQLSATYLTKGPSDLIECEVLPVEELQPWIALRHTGENEGAGLVPWGATEQGRYLERTAGRKAIELQFIDRYIEHMQGDAAAADRAKKVPATTLKRLLESKPVRDRLGITVNDAGWAYSDYPTEELLKWLRRVIDDISKGKVNARDLNKTKQMTDYIDSFEAHELPDTSKALKQPIPVEPVGKAATSQVSKKETKGPKPKPWSLRELKIRPAQVRLQDIIRELEQVSLERAPNIHGVMLRVFVELSTDDYLTHHKIVIAPDDGDRVTLKARINAAATHLQKSGQLTKNEMTAVNKMTAHARFYSTQTLNQFVHNQSLHPSPSDVIAMWKNLGPYLAKMQDR